MLDIMGEFFKI